MKKLLLLFILTLFLVPTCLAKDWAATADWLQVAPNCYINPQSFKYRDGLYKIWVKMTNKQYFSNKSTKYELAYIEVECSQRKFRERATAAWSIYGNLLHWDEIKNVWEYTYPGSTAGNIVDYVCERGRL